MGDDSHIGDDGADALRRVTERFASGESIDHGFRIPIWVSMSEITSPTHRLGFRIISDPVKRTTVKWARVSARFTRSVIRGLLSRPLVPIVTIQRDGYG